MQVCWVKRALGSEHFLDLPVTFISYFFISTTSEFLISKDTST